MPYVFRKEDKTIIQIEMNDRIDPNERANELSAHSWDKISKQQVIEIDPGEPSKKRMVEPPEVRIITLSNEKEALIEWLEERFKLPKGQLKTDIKAKLEAKK